MVQLITYFGYTNLRNSLLLFILSLIQYNIVSNSDLFDNLCFQSIWDPQSSIEKGLYKRNENTGLCLLATDKKLIHGILSSNLNKIKVKSIVLLLPLL